MARSFRTRAEPRFVFARRAERAGDPEAARPVQVRAAEMKGHADRLFAQAKATLDAPWPQELPAALPAAA